MKYRIKIWHIFFLLPVLISAQVGVNTTNPNALLDISTSNPSSPNNTDGLLIPKIEEYPATNPTALQDGMLVYATGNGSVAKGFYYWDNATTSWVAFSGSTIEKIDDLVDGKSDNDGTDDGSSIFLGVNAGANDDGSNNQSVGIGYEALSTSVNGYGNTAIGYDALSSNTSGNRNTVLGSSALTNNTTGWSNVAIGSYSLQLNTTGYLNLAVGPGAMQLNTSGFSNVALGVNALQSNTTGRYNTSVGLNALDSNISGYYNLALGYNAGRNTNGDMNVFLGFETGSGVSDTKEGSVFIGARAGYNESNSNRLYIENSTSASPLIYGEFDNDFLRVNGDFEVEKTTNASASVVTPFGYQSSLKLFERGTSGDYGFEFQYDGSPDKLYLWSRTFAGNEGIRMTWLKDGRVGMNDTAPDARLDIEAINQATPNNTDGILIPRVDAFPATNPSADQNGMLVFLTLDNSFYYWHNPTTTWVNIKDTSNSVERINDLADGKSDNDGSNNGSSIFLGIDAGANDNGTGNRNIGIGYQSLESNSSGYVNTAIGYESLQSNTTGYRNVAIGGLALQSNTLGTENTAVGYLASRFNTTGRYNTALGNSSLYYNTTGLSNTAVGYFSLSTNNTGDYNTAIGSLSLRYNTTGNSSTAIGYQSLYSNNSGLNNTAIGYQSMFLNTSGLGNSALGNESLASNFNGDYNSAIGYVSLYSNTSGNHNSALGYQSLYNNTTGDYNVAIGNRSLMTATIGNQNTAVGFEALETNNGNYNTAVGYIALDSNTNGDGNTSVGNQALSSNTSGDYNTSIGYRSLLDNSSGDQNVAVGYHALQNNTTGNNNVAIGYNSLNLVTTGYSNTALGTSAGAAGATFYNTTALGNGAAPNSPNQVRLGNSIVSVIGGYANWSNFSDRRLKTNIQENIVGLEFIKKLRPVSYNYDMDAIARFENTPDSLRIREAEKLKTQEIQTGFIAQEVEQAAQAVDFDFHGVVKPYDENGTYALRYAEFVVPLVKAMQEQQEIIETQNQELKSLREEIEAIKALLKENYKID